MMQSMEDYINGVYKKYEESEKKHEVYKTVKVKYQNPLTTLCSVAACLIIICIISTNVLKLKREISYVKNNCNIELNDTGNVVCTDIMSVDRKLNLSKLINKSNIIVITNENDNLLVNSEMKSGKIYLNSKGRLNIKKILKGNEIKSNTYISYMKAGGIISLIDLQKQLNKDFEIFEQTIIGKELSDEEKANSYFKQIPSKGTDFEKGKQYLVFLDYNEENDIYEITDLAYGIMEYDPVTNMVKNIDTGEFEEFDWSLIEQE